MASPHSGVISEESSWSAFRGHACIFFYVHACLVLLGLFVAVVTYACFCYYGGRIADKVVDSVSHFYAVVPSQPSLPSYVFNKVINYDFRFRTFR